MTVEARHCGADFRTAVLPGPNEALLTALRTAGNGDVVIDTRAGMKPGSDLFLAGIGYSNAAGAGYLGARISGTKAPR